MYYVTHRKKIQFIIKRKMIHIKLLAIFILSQKMICFVYRGSVISNMNLVVEPSKLICDVN